MSRIVNLHMYNVTSRLSLAITFQIDNRARRHDDYELMQCKGHIANDRLYEWLVTHTIKTTFPY